jgi:hypothetical protein
MFVKEEDRNVASNANFNGTYAMTPYPGGGPDFAPDVLNNAYYYGIRRYPYSRDMSKNPLTFKHIADANPLPSTPARGNGGASLNSEVHNAGEVWANMLWECYSSLLNDTGRLSFAQAQERMKRYLVASLKVTPLNPTFVEARDALLAVMQAQDATDADLCLTGFAKRGLGIGAVAPDSLSLDNAGVVESYSKTSGGGNKVLAVEYYNAGFDHYFVTWVPAEIANLDSGATKPCAASTFRRARATDTSSAATPTSARARWPRIRRSFSSRRTSSACSRRARATARRARCRSIACSAIAPTRTIATPRAARRAT